MARVSIEDCLEQVDNRFALVAIAADRARKIMSGDNSLIKCNNKEAVTALREIAAGKLDSIDTSPDKATPVAVSAVEAEEPPTES